MEANEGSREHQGTCSSIPSNIPVGYGRALCKKTSVILSCFQLLHTLCLEGGSGLAYDGTS